MNNPHGLYCCKCLNSLTPSCELSGWRLIEYIVFCHILWWIFYFILLIVTKQSEEWCCRLLTFFHGCLISYCSLKNAYVNKSRVDFNRSPLSESKKYYLSYMFSYFLFDFCWIYFFGNEAKIIYFHHISSIFTIFNILLKNNGSPGIDYGAAGLELTNPYLQLRWFLRTHGYYDTLLHKLIELWFVIMFTIIRIFGGTVFIYYAAVKSDMDIVTKFTFSSIYVISLVLQWQIITFLKKKYLRNNQALRIRSRVSISLYFQRRTLNRYQQGYYNEGTQNNEELSTSKELSGGKEFSASEKTAVKKETSASAVFHESIESSESKEPSETKEYFSKEESSAPLPLQLE